MVDAKTTVLVVGSSGFIGSHIVDMLIDLGVVVVCGTHQGHGVNSALAQNEMVHVVSLDKHNQVHAARPSDFAVDTVINLATPGVSADERHPSQMLRASNELILSLWESLRSSPPGLIVHIGSWSEYGGNPDGLPLKEGDSITPTSVYGAAKASAGIQVNALARDAGVRIVNLRLFNVFGPGERKNRLVPYVMRRLQAFEPADLTPGGQVRDITYIDDIVEALVLACDADLEPYVAYNVCSGIPTSIRYVATTIADMMDRPRSLLRFGARPYRVDEPLTVVGDSSKFRRATGWEPKVTVERGLATMVSDQLGRGVDQ